MKSGESWIWKKNVLQSLSSREVFLQSTRTKTDENQVENHSTTVHSAEQHGFEWKSRNFYRCTWGTVKFSWNLSDGGNGIEENLRMFSSWLDDIIDWLRNDWQRRKKTLRNCSKCFKLIERSMSGIRRTWKFPATLKFIKLCKFFSDLFLHN